MKGLMDSIKIEFPDKAIDISESLQLLKEVITSTIDNISSKAVDALSAREYNTIDKYVKLAEEATRYEKLIEEYIDQLELDNDEIIVESREVNLGINEKQFIPNYSDYLVDNQIEHTLYENWMHIRPYGFRFINNELIDARLWNDVFTKMCEILYDIDSEKFADFENISYLNGKKKKYFSKNPKDLRKPYEIRNEVFVEINHSANTFRNIILRMIKEYKLKPTDFMVYYWANYTELNKK